MSEIHARPSRRKSAHYLFLDTSWTATAELRQVLKEHDDFQKWLTGKWLPPEIKPPSISLDDPVTDLSMGELFDLVYFQVDAVFAERQPAPTVTSKPAIPIKLFKLSQSTRNAVDYVVGQRDDAELRRFLRRFPKDQLDAIESYMAQKGAAP